MPLDWKPTADEMQRLGPEGKRFIESAIESHEYNFIAGGILLDMAYTLDMLAHFRKDIDTRGLVLEGRRGGVRLNPSVRAHSQILRGFGALAKQLNLGAY